MSKRAARSRKMRIRKAGQYQLSEADYHADPCVKPSLSASIAHILLSQSARHAWWSHARLNPAYESEDSAVFDLGRAAHACVLEGQSGVVIIEASDFRTTAAKEARDAARAAGKMPILAEKWADVQAMAAAARHQLADHESPIPLISGKPEQTLIWREGDVWCRARIDWLHDDRRYIDDYKSTGASANPDVWTRGPLFANGADLQAAWYCRGVQAVFGVEATFRFVVQENFKPYALSVIGLAPEALALGHRKVASALAMWTACLAANTWPGYPTRTCYADVPPWEEARQMEREYRNQPAPVIDDGRPLVEQMTEDSSKIAPPNPRADRLSVRR